MTIIAADTKLGELVTAHPGLARELERRNLDYCCGGASSLGEACSAQGLDVDAVVSDLQGAADDDEPLADWASMDARALADHIESTHHHYLHEELPRIGELVAKIVQVHGARHPELTEISEAFDAVRADLEPHLRKEERVLFPLVRDPDASLTLIERPIAMMAMEHDRVGDLLKQLRMLTHDFEVPPDGCATYAATFAALEQLEADTHLHIHKENNVLFPMALKL